MDTVSLERKSTLNIQYSDAHYKLYDIIDRLFEV